jgi:Fur family transcriptional regulator, zinc uptake regulator
MVKPLSDQSSAVFPAPEHNHVACVSATLDRARAAFDGLGLRLTDLRLRVFTEIAQSHHAIGAYEIIDRLADKGSRLAPVSVYRVIDTLIEAGVVHRLESGNAFFACHAAHAGHRQHVVLSCGSCRTIAEVDGEDVFGALDQIVGRHGFTAASRIVEIAGTCARCAEQPELV